MMSLRQISLRRTAPLRLQLIFAALLLCVLASPHKVFAQQPGTTTTSAPVTPAPSANNPVPGSNVVAAPPASSSGGVQIAPSANAPQGQGPAPGSNARPLTPAGQTDQSVQPSTQADQQTRSSQPSTALQPQAPQGNAPSLTTTDSLPANGNNNGDNLAPSVTNVPAPSSGATPQAPGSVIQPAQVGTRQPGRESVVSPAPENLPNVPDIAPDFRADQSRALPELGRVGVDMANQRPLALREAIEMALSNNKDIEVARENVQAAEFDLRGARGVYEPRLSSLSYYERTKTPVSSSLSGGSNGAVTQADFTGTARAEGLVKKGGGGYRVDFSSIRLNTDNQFVSLNPQYPTALTFNYTQPILRGFRFDANRRNIEVAKKNLSMTDAQFRQRAIETITSVQRAYWDLVFTLRNLQIQRDAVRDARAQFEHNRRLVTEGQLAPIDVVAADAQVSGFEQSVYSALDDVQRAENNLKNLIAENRNAALWSASIVPTDNVNVTPPSILLPEAITAAMTNRPELQQSDVARAINELDQRFYQEQTKTQVDLIASYGGVGLAGPLNRNAGTSPFTSSNARLTDRINQLSQLNGLPALPAQATTAFPAELIGGYAQSLTNLALNRFNNFRVGVQINLPFRNTAAQAQLGRSLVESRRIGTQREQLEQLVQVDVRNALQSVRTSESRLRSAAAARSASEQQLESEKRRFDAGQSTIFLVLERQTALATARGNELRAQTDLNKAAADVQRATGNALEANNVVVRVR
ncbi:MAG: TolC family protein [Pyrinomonadaceae bacterium]